MATADDIEQRSRAWVDAGIIDEAQRARILDVERSEAAAAAHPAARERMQVLFGVVGALLVGLGVVATAIANWDAIGDLTKLAMLVGTLVAAHAGGLLADSRGVQRWVGSVAYAVGMIVFGGGIFVIAELYNVRAHEPLGLLLVGMTGVALALLADRTGVGWISAFGMLGWALHELVLSLDELDDAQVLAPLFASVLLGGIAATSLGWALSGRAWRSGIDGASGPAALVQRADVVAVPLRSLAMVATTFALVQATFAWHLDDELESAASRPQPWIALAAALASAWLMSRWSTLAHGRAVVGCMLVVVGVALVVAAWPHDVLVSVLASAVLALGGVGLVLAGLVESRRELFAWGLGWIVVVVVTRYVDFMVSVELGGPGFIGAGLLLIAVAVLLGRSRTLWRRRTEVLR